MEASRRNPPETASLSGKVALITGGSNGIGRAMSLALAASGVRVTITYHRNVEAAEETEAMARAMGVRDFSAVRLDAAESPAPLIQRMGETMGRLDILVNNAAVAHASPLHRLPIAEWNRMMDVNLTGAFRALRAAIPWLSRTRGSVVNVGTYLVNRGSADTGGYVSSKAALVGLSLAAAAELSPLGIRVNVLQPGFIETQMVQGYGETSRARIRKRISLARFGQPEELARTLLWLVSDATTGVTGTVLRLDGGVIH
jgi:3-oxoacyl-[acyl-carrier protein] reductase